MNTKEKFDFELERFEDFLNCLELEFTKESTCCSFQYVLDHVSNSILSYLSSMRYSIYPSLRFSGKIELDIFIED